MEHNKKIVIISQSHLCRNPRIVKEATILATAGYQVVIITSIFSKELFEQDLTLIEGLNIEIKLVSDLTKNGLQQLSDKVKRKLGFLAKKYLNIDNYFTLGYGINRYLEICRAENADLYLCHQELATYIGVKLIRKKFKVGFDFEDWYSEDLLENARKTRSIRILQKNERFALHHGEFSYTTSNALANQLSAHYQCKVPYTIYNVFPQPVLHFDEQKEFGYPIKLFWFSQFIGPGRGLEEFFSTINAFSIPIELNLLGQIDPSYKDFLIKSLSEKNSIIFHKMISAKELPAKIADFDIGLALEKTTPKSRNLTITNKFFQYIQSGLPIISSSTEGQKEIFSNTKIGFLLPIDPTTSFTTELEDWMTSHEKLNLARRAAIELSKSYNWEHEEKKLLEIVKNHI